MVMVPYIGIRFGRTPSILKSTEMKEQNSITGNEFKQAVKDLWHIYVISHLFS